MNKEENFISFEMTNDLVKIGFKSKEYFAYFLNDEEYTFKVGEMDFEEKEVLFGCPTHQQVFNWFRDKDIDITIMPVFREKCGYDSFKRDGWTFTVLRIDPCQYLDYTHFNQCYEDRVEDDKEVANGEVRLLETSYKEYYDCVNSSIKESIRLLECRNG